MELKQMNKRIQKEEWFDYYGETEQDFYQKLTVNSVLVQGKHREPAPLVTILLMTYKRSCLLKQALESALNQIGFDDYQIIVADNEGEDINTETETSRLMANYQDEKVIYYRHEQSVEYKGDSIARLARSKWICFLHDDDVMASNHLVVMSRIVQEHKEISFLSSALKSFVDNLSKEDFDEMVKVQSVKYQILKYPKSHACYGFYANWQGALIDRERYIAMGGMPTLSTGLGDYIMVQKFHYCYGVHQLSTETPLYFYRQWSGQDQSSGTEVWKKVYQNEYKYHAYVSKIYHPHMQSFWNRISAYRILQKCKDKNSGYYNLNIDLKEMVKLCGMPEGVLKRSFRYKLDMALMVLYKKVTEILYRPMKHKGRIEILLN